MLMIGHTAIGVATGLFIPNPIAAFFLGIVTHHLADWVPHFDQGSFMDFEEWKRTPIRSKLTKRDIMLLSVDIFLNVALVGYAFSQVAQAHWTAVAAGIVGANLPDLVHNIPLWNKRTRQIRWIRWWQDNIHRRFHSPISLSMWYFGVAPQLIVIGVAIWAVVKRG